MRTSEIVKQAKEYFPTIKKVYPRKLTTVKNHINSQMMYRLPVLLDNGGKGYHHAFYMYVDTELNNI